MIKEAQKGDEAALEAFFARHFATTMFMRGNLRDFGLHNRQAPYGMRYFMYLPAPGAAINGVGALANNGTLMMQADSGHAEIIAHMAAQLPRNFVPNVITGAPGQVAALVAGLNLGGFATKLNETEPLYTLASAGLQQPDMAGYSLRPSTMEDLPLLAAWNHAYDQEVLGGDDSEASRQTAQSNARTTIERGHQRLLLKNGAIVAQTNFNAALPETVQVGGVYTPPEHRNQGHARRVVGAHLAEAFAAGAQNAVLFSASEAASRAYCALGFECIGAYQIILFKGR